MAHLKTPILSQPTAFYALYLQSYLYPLLSVLHGAVMLAVMSRLKCRGYCPIS